MIPETESYDKTCKADKAEKKTKGRDRVEWPAAESVSGGRQTVRASLREEGLVECNAAATTEEAKAPKRQRQIDKAQPRVQDSRGREPMDQF